MAPALPLAGEALAVRAVAANDEAAVDQGRQMPPQRRGAMPCARSASCWLEGKTIRPSPLSVGLRMEAQQSVENRERAFGSADLRLGRADRAEHLPLVHGLVGRPRFRRSPGSPHGQASAIAAQRASLKCEIACLRLQLGKEKSIAETALGSNETLDSDSRK